MNLSRHIFALMEPSLKRKFLTTFQVPCLISINVIVATYEWSIFNLASYLTISVHHQKGHRASIVFSWFKKIRSEHFEVVKRMKGLVSSLLRPSVCSLWELKIFQTSNLWYWNSYIFSRWIGDFHSKQAKLPLKERSLGPNLLKDPLPSTHLFRCFFSEFQRWEDQNSHKKSTLFAWQFFDLLRKITKIPKENPMDEWT